MRRNIPAIALAMLLAGALVLAPGGQAGAQKKKGDAEKAKKTAEERIQKGKQGRDAAADTLGKAGRGEVSRERDRMERRVREHAGDSAVAEGARKRYRPKGLSEERMEGWRDGTPPGWGRGEKTGWGGEGAPPGQREKARDMRARRYPAGEKEWGDRDREDFDRRIERARERVREKARVLEGVEDSEIESAEISVEEAARVGVPVEQAESSVGRAMEAGMSGPEIEQMTRAMAYGAERSVDQEKLGSFVESRIEAGERGDDLAVSIYEQVDRMEAQAPPEPEQPKEEKKVPWYKRIFGRD
ncbi:MAG: hypothetical protein PHQ19_04025 [Candidatus Krumholzibacteria bacterium]|nr:hypothetical protein [Candidatus Krumholzibacteria bacterium]